MGTLEYTYYISLSFVRYIYDFAGTLRGFVIKFWTYITIKWTVGLSG